MGVFFAEKLGTSKLSHCDTSIASQKDIIIQLLWIIYCNLARVRHINSEHQDRFFSTTRTNRIELFREPIRDPPKKVYI